MAGRKGATVLITGAAGNIGSTIGKHLIKSDRFSRIIATDLHLNPPNLQSNFVSSSPKYEYHGDIDLVDQHATNDIIIKNKPEVIVHVGAFPGPAKTPPPTVDPHKATNNMIGLENISPSELLQTNIASTYNVFSAAAQSGCRRVVFSSSAFALGWSHNPVDYVPKYLPIDETHPSFPHETYGLSKDFGEQIAAMLTRSSLCNTSFISLRFTNIIKPDKWSELPWDAPADGSLNLPMWAYVHADDVIEAHIRAIDLDLRDCIFDCKDTDALNLSLLLAARDTRFKESTADLLARHYTPNIMQKIQLRASFKNNASPIDASKSWNILGISPRCWSDEKSKNKKETSSILPPTNTLSADPELPSLTSPSPQTFYAGDVTLQSGKILKNTEIVYTVHGNINEDYSNIVLHPTSFGAKHTDLAYRIGSGDKYTLNTEKYCVIVVNMLGNGISTSPSEKRFCGLKKWPWPNIYDNVMLQRRLLKEELGMPTKSKLAMIFGYSMGAMQALQFGVMFPENVERIVAVCGAARTSHYNRVFLASLREALLTDGTWDNNKQQFINIPIAGLRTFATIYAGWGLGSEFYSNEEFINLQKEKGTNQTFSSLEDFVECSYVDGFANDDPHNLLAMIHAWDTGDVSANDNFNNDLALALSALKAHTFIMPCSADRYFSVTESYKEFELMTSAEFHMIPSSWGHRAGDPHRPGQKSQNDFITHHVRTLFQKTMYTGASPMKSNEYWKYLLKQA